MSGHIVITFGLARAVHAEELQSGDVFALHDAPHTRFVVAAVDKMVLSHELTVCSLTLAGHAQALTLPSRTQVLAHRMLRTVPMTCVLCGRRHDINLDLPRDGQPVSLVCSDHEPASGHPSTPQREGEG